MKRRRKHRSSKEVAKIGMAWYRPEQWNRLRQISEDVEVFETNYEEWESLASQKIAGLKAAGIKIEKVEVDVNELLSYCNEHRFSVNAESRSKFVTDKLSKRAEREGIELNSERSIDQ